MKKLMISTIIILPLILLAVLLVSGAIMSMVTHIYVESVEFVKSEALILTMSDEAAPPEYDVTDEITVLPLRAKNRDLRFSTDNENIVTIDENGIVKAAYYGETYITVTSRENKAAVAKRKVIVTDKNVHALTLNEGFKTELYEREKAELSVSIFPKEAENKSLTWKSSNESVLHVSANGTVTAVGAGEATVTVTSNDNQEATDFATFRCYKQLRDLKVETASVVSSAGEFDFPKITPYPADAEIELTYSSSDPAIAKVDENGHIRFEQAGKVVITVTGKDFGGNTVEKSITYTSTYGYYKSPLFEVNQYAVDFDEYYGQGKPLDIPFAPGLKDTYREFLDAYFEIDGEEREDILRVDSSSGSNIRFYFKGEMPEGKSAIKAIVKAKAYNETTGEVEIFEDFFDLTVTRNAQDVAFSYKGKEAAKIVISSTELDFSKGAAAVDADNVGVVVEPSNHTNAYSYAITGENAGGATLKDGKLTFPYGKAASVTVKLSLRDADGVEHAWKEVSVIYAPPIKQETGGGTDPKTPAPKPIEVVESAEDEAAPEQPPIVLEMSAPAEGAPEETAKQEGILYFAEPAGATVSYEVVKEAEEDPAEEAVVTIENRGGVRYIVPQRGGFATIAITVTSDASEPVLARRAQAREGGVKVYTFEVYVNRPVSADDFTVTLDGRSEFYYNTIAKAYTFGTALTSVPYTCTVIERDQGAMEGKQIRVTIDGKAVDVDADLATYSNSIAFGEDRSELTLIFGVEYSEKATRLLGEGAEALNITRTIILKRNAKDVALTYKGADVQTVATTSSYVTFTTEAVAEGSASQVGVNVIPATHTNTLAFSIEDASSVASITAEGRLTFKEAGEAHVRISLLGEDGKEAFRKLVTVSYAPLAEQEKAVEIRRESENYNLLFSGTNGAGVIYFSEPDGAEVSYDIAENEGVVKFEKKATGIYTVTPLKGGFAKITVTAGERVYTVNVYVDIAVSASALNVVLGSTAIGETNLLCTAEEDVPFTVTFRGAEDAMQGKQLYLKSAATNAEGAEGAISHTGNITFGEELGAITLTFGVKYSERAAEVGAQEGTLAFVVRTVNLYRNPTDVAFSYDNTETTQISTSETRLTFNTNSQGTSIIYVEILPASAKSVCTVEYAIAEGDTLATLTGGTLTFNDETQTASVTVKVSIKAKDGTMPVEESVKIAYAPRSDENKELRIDEEHTELYTTLRMNANDTKDTGIIRYTVPADYTAEYKSDDPAVANVTEKDGTHFIEPIKGGLTTVTVTATHSGDGAEKIYTIHVYVDRKVTPDDFVVKFGAGDQAKEYGANDEFATTLTSVPYSVTVNGKEGCMEGKKIVVSDTAGENIAFPENSGTLVVNISVVYDTEKVTEAYGATGGLAATTRTLQRDSSSLTLSYHGVAPQKIVTDKNTFDLGGITTVLPTSHTDILSYSVIEGDAASVNAETGILTFRNAGSVKVKVEVKRGEKVNLEKIVTVCYDDAAAAEKFFAEGDTEKYLVFSDGKLNKVVFYYTLAEDKTAACTLTEGDGVVTLSEENGTWHVTAEKGGFATVQLTVGDTVYTVRFYVDAAVRESELGVALTDVDESNCTAATSIPFTFTFTGKEDAMQGKKLVVSYNGAKQYGDAGVTTLGGDIAFGAELGRLSVKFGVEYDQTLLEGFDLQTSPLPSISRTLLHNAKSLALLYKGVAVGKIVTDKAALDIGEITVVTPAVFADEISYTLEEGEGVAKLREDGNLTFSMSGIATVKVQLKLGERVTFEKSVTVCYDDPSGARAIELSGDTTKYVALSLGNTAEEAVFYFALPEGEGQEGSYALDVEGIIEIKEENGTWRVTPKKGGFANLTLTVGGTEYTLHFYVNVPVTAENFAIVFQNNYTTLNSPKEEGERIVYYSANTVFKSIKTKITINKYLTFATTEIMAGKQIFVTYGETTVKGATGAVSYTPEIKFDTESRYDLIVGVQYDESKTAGFGLESGIVYSFDRYTIATTNGNLLNHPNLTYKTTSMSDYLPLTSEADIVFEGEGKTATIMLETGSTLDPNDFNKMVADGEGPVEISGNHVQATWVQGGRVRLTAIAACTHQLVRLTYAGQSYSFYVTVYATAQTIAVSCGVGKEEIQLQADTKYKTLLPTLDFKVTIGNPIPGLNIANKDIEYSFDDWKWTKVESDSLITEIKGIDLRGMNGNSLFFRSADGGVSIQILIEYVSSPEFGYDLLVNSSTGKSIFATIENVKGGEKLAYTVPGDMADGAITFKIDILDSNGNYLGGFGTQNTSATITDHDNKTLTWNTPTIEVGGEIIFELPTTGDFTMTCTITAYDKTFTVTLSHYNLSIQFPGYDSGNSVDVYKGYQQVRVFAKQSDYGAGAVDYFKLPVRAINNNLGVSTAEKQLPVDSLTWTFTGFKGKEATGVTLSQTGAHVTFNGQSYLVVKGEAGKPSSLKTATVSEENGEWTEGDTVIAQGGKYAANQTRVPWVDIYAEDGYVHLYFGDFKGLSEIDVQNDYFGNFAESVDYVQKAQVQADDSGRDFAPSENAYSFLRVSAGFGTDVENAQSGKDCHFNFNILEGSDIFNVFNAAGYYAHGKVVLHNNLYGSENKNLTENPLYKLDNPFNTDEVEETEENRDQFLRSTSNLGKDIVYGNGYSISYNAMNEQLKSTMHSVNEEGAYSSTLGNYGGVNIGSVYNATLRGRNPSEDFSENDTGVVFVFKYCYYSNIQHYYKVSPSNGQITYFKNSVMNKAVKGIQLYYDNAKAYFENMMIYDCIMAVCCEGTGSGEGKNLTAIFQGEFNDILNYQSINTLTAAMNKNPMIGMALQSGWKMCESFGEWFGLASENNGQSAKTAKERFINPVVFSVFYSTSDKAGMYERANGVKVEGRNGQVYTKALDLLAEGSPMQTPAAGWTYNTDITVDGGRIEGSKCLRDDFSKLFTTNRYIRLLCEYKDINGDKLIKNDDHILWHIQRVYRDVDLIEGRTSDHIQALKESLQKKDWDHTWPDGTKLEEALKADPVAALARMLSETALPVGRED